MLDKTKIHEKIIEQLREDKETLERAALATRDEATHEESAAENRYDTRGLEASYLAGAQSKRATEINQAYQLYQQLQLRTFDANTPIGLSALLQVEDERGRQWYFLGPAAGGIKIECNGTQITVITPQSPLGEALVGAREGDVVELEKPGGIAEYEILQVS